MCRGGQSPWTREILAELGFLYESNALDDDFPYWETTASGPMLVLPYGFDSNDMKFFHPNGFARPQDFSSYVDAALDVLLDEADAGKSSMLSVAPHLRICGRPGGFAAVRSILDRLRKAGRAVWIARRQDIARHAADQLLSLGIDADAGLTDTLA